MRNSERIQNEFYQHLGKLFYAIAMADKQVKRKEAQQLQKDITKYWLELDAVKDEFGEDAAHQIGIVFDWLRYEEAQGAAYFNAFAEFYRDHPDIFDPHIKSLILRTCNDIASSFAGKNKSELILLAKLQTLFNKGS